jgi:hypothetical protein
VPVPKTFISYSWSSPEHQQWVIDLATQLRDNGVDATLDKWDLKEGHDSKAFMEKMVTDPAVEKVILVSDRVYAEKADVREPAPFRGRQWERAAECAGQRAVGRYGACRWQGR